MVPYAAQCACYDTFRHIVNANVIRVYYMREMKFNREMHSDFYTIVDNAERPPRVNRRNETRHCRQRREQSVAASALSFRIFCAAPRLMRNPTCKRAFRQRAKISVDPAALPPPPLSLSLSHLYIRFRNHAPRATSGASGKTSA